MKLYVPQRNNEATVIEEFDTNATESKFFFSVATLEVVKIAAFAIIELDPVTNTDAKSAEIDILCDCLESCRCRCRCHF